MLGKLTIDALPFYSGIAMGGALITVFGALGAIALVTWLGRWRYLWTEWLTSLDHKKIGIMYVTLALIMLVRGFIDAMMIRTQQAVALDSHGYLPPDHFDQIFTSHATIMVFFVVSLALVSGLGNFIIPLQIGARDMAFPFLNMLSFWIVAPACIVLLASFAVEGGAAAAEPEGLFTAGEQAAEFQRTVSRLHEMQSVEYLQTERRR